MGLALNAWKESNDNKEKKWIVTRLPFNQRVNKTKNRTPQKSNKSLLGENRPPNKNTFGLLEL
jgi:hypothetical protein